MTLRFQCHGQGGDDLGWVGTRHLCYDNYDDPRLLILISGYLVFLPNFLHDLEISGSRLR